MSLIELLVAIALSGIVSLFFARLFIYSSDVISDLEKAAVMHDLANTLEAAAGRSDVVIESANVAILLSDPGNKGLKGCITQKRKGQISQVQTCTFQFTNPDAQVPFNLVMPSGKLVSTLSLADIRAKTIAGGQKPIYYTFSGKKCSDQEALTNYKCELEAIAYFFASCPTDQTQLEQFQLGKRNAPPVLASSCARADSIHVRVQIRHQIHEKNKDPNPQKMASIPRDNVFFNQPTYAASNIRVDSINPVEIEIDCPINQTVIKIEHGQAVCKCLPPFQEGPPDAVGNSSCTIDHVCPSRTRYKGIDKNGKVKCAPIVAISRTLQQGCPRGSWMTGVGAIVNGSTNRGCTYRDIRNLSAGNAFNDQTGGNVARDIECDIPITCHQEQASSP